MNSESLGHYLFGQGKPERRSKVTTLDAGKSLNPGEGRCASGICEVAWKPNQQNCLDLDQIESISSGD
jgi:hypothetical protein